MKTETLYSCPICQSPNIKRVDFNHCDVCEDCGQAFGNPRLDDESTAEYYAGEYRDVMSAPKSNGIDPIDILRQRERARLQFKLCEPFIQHCKSVLEIGSSLGNLLDQLNIYYDMVCVGIEPDERYHHVDPAQSFTLYKDISECPPRKFDLIAMSHSLEHLNHPREYLQYLVDNYAHEKTLILIEVPNMDEFQGTVTVNHPFGFTEKTLNGLLARVGYKPLYFVKHGLSYPQGLYLLGVYKHA